MVEGGRWKVEKVEGRRWKVEGGRWKVEGGRWKVEGGRWKVEGRRWKVEGREKNTKDLVFGDEINTMEMCKFVSYTKG
jgi:hypothetical protein